MAKRYTKKTLRAAAEEYFDSISTLLPVVNGRGDPMKDAEGHMIFRRDFFVPPKESALCLRLGITLTTWEHYYADEELRPVVEWVKLVCFNWLQEQSCIRDKPNGIIFNLRHNYARFFETDAGYMDALDGLCREVFGGAE